MTVTETVNIAAIVISPLVAVVVSLILQKRSEDRKTKLWIISTLISNRHQPICGDNIRALHQIDMVFARNNKVRSLWHRYFDLVGSIDGQGEMGFRKREQVYRDMLYEMARSVGFYRTIEPGDIERVYSPTGHVQGEQRNQQILEELLRVLKGTQSLSGARPESADSQVEMKPQPASL